MTKDITVAQQARKLLSDVPKEQVFLCCDGKEIRNLKELVVALSTMKDDTFSYHWNKERKDFSEWVNNAVGDKKLASDLEKATSRNHAAWKVADRLVYLVEQLP